MLTHITAGEMVRQLRRCGIEPPERLVQPILRSGEAARAPLLELATGTEQLHEDPPDCYGPIHALRLLGEIPSVEMIEPLLSQLPLPIYTPDDDLPQLWATEAPQIIARIGARALEPLWQLADDPERTATMRGAALEALAYLTAFAPETRKPVVAGLRERLGTTDDQQIRSYLVVALANIGVADVYREVMEHFRAGRVDHSIITPAVARQLLLTKGHQRLSCVNHSLAERYREHGPRAEEQ